MVRQKCHFSTYFLIFRIHFVRWYLFSLILSILEFSVAVKSKWQLATSSSWKFISQKEVSTRLCPYCSSSRVNEILLPTDGTVQFFSLALHCGRISFFLHAHIIPFPAHFMKINNRQLRISWFINNNARVHSYSWSHYCAWTADAHCSHSCTLLIHTTQAMIHSSRLWILHFILVMECILFFLLKKNGTQKPVSLTWHFAFRQVTIWILNSLINAIQIIIKTNFFEWSNLIRE